MHPPVELSRDQSLVSSLSRDIRPEFEDHAEVEEVEVVLDPRSPPEEP